MVQLSLDGGDALELDVERLLDRGDRHFQAGEPGRLWVQGR